MAGKFVDVRHDDRRAARGRGTAHALAPGNAYAGRLALKRAEHEFALSREVKPGPIQFGQTVIEQRGHVGRVCDEVGLAGDQRGELRCEIAVELAFVISH